MTIDTTITFEHLNECDKRIIHCIGGSRSGKSFGITQWLIVQALQSPIDISIVRRTIPSLKRTNIKDFKGIMQTIGIWSEESYNISDRVYRMNNGSTFNFINTDDPDKLRGYSSTILWLDEASEIDEESFFQLSIRTSGKIILSYNPTVSPFSWIRQMYGRDDVQTFVTTYRDNPYLPKDMVRAIEDLKEKNPKYWKIYGLGEFAPNDKAVYQFDVVDEIEGELVAYGLDWGYSQDPLGLVGVYRNGEDLYLKELIYERGLVMKEIGERLQSLGIDRTYEIWCDSSEPRSVEELYRMGFNAKAVKKGPDSKRFGISVLQNYRIKVEKRSQNLINEIYSYQYRTDKGGYVTDEPEDGLDHLLDAARYVAMSRLTVKQQNRGKYTLMFK